MSTNNFTKTIVDRISQFCKEVGFNKSAGKFNCKINENVTAWLHFGIANYHSTDRYVCPTVGIKYNDISNLSRALYGYIPHDTWGTPLGYLMPENTYKEWQFCCDSDNEQSFADMFDSIRTYAFPTINELSSIDGLLKYLDKQPITLPLALYTIGDYQKGLAIIEQRIDQQRKKLQRPAIKRLFMADGQIVEEELLDEESLRKAYRQKLPEQVESMEIVGADRGGVDPSYLEFYEKYKRLCNGTL